MSCGCDVSSAGDLRRACPTHAAMRAAAEAELARAGEGQRQIGLLLEIRDLLIAIRNAVGGAPR